jgi:hypothetical protein
MSHSFALDVLFREDLFGFSRLCEDSWHERRGVSVFDSHADAAQGLDTLIVSRGGTVLFRN